MTRPGSRVAIVTGAIALTLVAASAEAQSSCTVQNVAPQVSSTNLWEPPFDRPVSLQVTDQSLRDALDRLAASAGIHLSYSPESLPLDRPVCASFKGVPLGFALRQLLGGLNVNPVSATSGHVVLAPIPGGRALAPEPPTWTMIPLERVVVTGSVVGGSQRHLPFALNAVSTERLATSNTGSLPQLLNGSIPGMWAWGQSPSDLLVRYGSVRGASSFGASYPKVYIDGIEVANPLVLSDLTPETISRVEVIRGPQGAALYGTDAISGVINILTRNDSVELGAPRLSFRSGVGFAESDFTTGNALRQNHSLTARGGGGNRTGVLNFAVATDGDFVPGAFSRQLSLNGNSRWVSEKAIATSTLRIHGERAATGTSPLLSPLTIRPTAGQSADSLGNPLAAQSVFQYTVGTTVKLMPAGAWMHSIVVGVDGYRLTGAVDDYLPVHPVFDQGIVGGGGADRATIRGSTMRQIPASGPTTGTLTFTAEQSILREEVAAPRANAQGSGVIAAATAADAIDWQHDWGIAGQANISHDNMLFLSGGLRVEHSSAFLTGSTRSVLPMLGAAVVTGRGPFEVKFRTAYGKGIRPPRLSMRETMWGGRGSPIVNRNLSPEVQTGIEGGVDLTIGQTAGLQITRFDQLASGLIQSVAVAEVWMPARNRRRVLYQLQNVGEISNRGWEVQGSLAFGQLSLAANVSTVDSRVQKLAIGYTGDLRPGDRMLEVPERTGGLAVNWSSPGFTASISAARAWNWINYDRLALVTDFANAEELRPDLTGNQLRSYWLEYDGINRLDANFRFPIRRDLDLTFGAENLLNEQMGEPDNLTILPGRTVTLGASARF